MNQIIKLFKDFLCPIFEDFLTFIAVSNVLFYLGKMITLTEYVNIFRWR